MFSKITTDDFNESAGNRILQAELEKHNRIKTYFLEKDRTPNTDGYFEVLDRQGFARKRFVVQIKTVRNMTRLKSGDYSYSAQTAFLHFILENIDQNPAVYFIVNLATGTLYYKYLSLEYILSLSIGHKRTIALHLNDSDVVDEGKLYDYCVSLMREREVEDSRILTKALLPDPNELFYYEHIDESVLHNHTQRVSSRHFPLPVGAAESKLLRIPPAILQKYENIKLLGSGGTSKVFSLTSRLTGRKVVLKVAPIQDSFARPLLNEFKKLDRLRHPSIPRVLDYFSDDETEYLTMDLIEGHTLTELTRSGAFNLVEIIAVISELCDVVTYLHRNGLVHRDLKPSNIILGPSHSITVIDFDTATDINESVPQYSFMGTLRYAAPETYSPGYVSKVPSSIYSIGATLYYSLINEETRKFLKTLNSPFELCDFISNYSGDELGYGLTILRNALAFDPDKRYPGAQEMQADLMIWQKKEYLNPSVLNQALARNRESYYSSVFPTKGQKRKRKCI